MQNLEDIEQLKAIVQLLLDEAKQQGASAAEADLMMENGLSVTARLGDVETIEHHCDQGLAISVYFGQRKGTASTTDFSRTSLTETVSAASSIARHTSADDCAGLPEQTRLAVDFPQLDLYHPWAIDADAAIGLAIECEQAALAYDEAISNSEGATVNTHQGIKVLGNTLGFVQGYATSRHSLSCSVLGQQGDSMQRDYWYSVARNAHNLESAAAIGAKAAERALKRLGGRSLSTRQAPVLYAAEIAGSLLGALIGAISGGNLYRKASFLMASLGTQIFPDFIHFHERPHLRNALGSAPYDAEGVATKDKAIIHNGVVQSYLLNSYAARKLGMQSTANAGGVYNPTLAPGALDFNGLLKQMDTGLLVTELMGQGVNMVTGDYSRGASGFWVAGGEIQFPVEEITIAGNMKDMFKHIVAVGNDVDYRSNIRTGSLLIEQMSIAGA